MTFLRRLLVHPWFVAALMASSASLARASEGGGHEEGVPWNFLAWHAINLTILVGALVYLVRRPLRDALANRAIGVRRAIEEAQKARDSAEARHKELQAQLVDFHSQVEKMRNEVRAEAEKERQHILDQAQREAAAILAGAERAIRDETLRARRSLQQESVELAIKLAEDVLRNQVSEQDHSRLSGDLLASIRTDGARHGL